MSRICSSFNVFTGESVELEFNQTIQKVTPVTAPAGAWVSPGWIDVQVNGYAGVDYNTPDTPHEEIARSIHVLFSTGLARFYPTVITNSPQNILGSLANLAAARESLAEGAAMDGFHVEGPHISPEDGPRGAHPRRWVRPPDIEEFKRWQDAARGHIRIVTLAPEWPEAPHYIEHLAAQGVVVSIGHTGATSEQIAAAVSAGASMSTHLGNGAHAIIRRNSNYILDQLADDRLMASFIVDGVHLQPAFVKSAVRAKTTERAVLVTDAAMPSGCAPGFFRLGEVDVELTADNRIVLRGQDRLSASALSIDRAIGNLMRFAGLSLADAVRLATINAARAGRVPGRQLGLVPGERADFTVFRFDSAATKITVEATYLDGEKVWG